MSTNMTTLPQTSPLWGEIPVVADTDSGIAALEREQITKPRPMDIEGPPLHQPSSRHKPPTNEVLPSHHFQMDPVVLHTIRLLGHIKRLNTAIEVMRSDVKHESDLAVTSVGPTPEYEGPAIKDRSRQRYFTEEEYQTDFVKGVPDPPPPIDDHTCRKLLRRSTCAILAHLNFDTARDSVVDTMTDLCHQFLRRFMTQLGAAVERRAQYGPDGFPDAIERTCVAMGVGSASNLHTFYQQRVLAYHRRTQEQCAALMREYTALSTQVRNTPAGSASLDSGSTDTLHVIRIKEEPSADLQFPLLDEASGVTEAEQLLNIESLGTFEITVEHETAAGLTTEETKWSQSGKQADAKSRQQGVVAGTPSSTPATTPSEETGLDGAQQQPDSVGGTPQSVNVPRTPQSHSGAPPSTPQAPTPGGTEDSSIIQEPGSISSMDIFSPASSVHTPAPPSKKRKKN